MAHIVVHARTARTAAQLAGVLVASLVAHEAVVVPRIRVTMHFLLVVLDYSTTTHTARSGLLGLLVVGVRSVAVLAADRRRW